MLFFLRNIRRKMLSNNKITTYLLYAIGEILLVVIGILIAVSIDDHQKEKQHIKLKDWYLASIQSEVKKNLNILDELDSLGSIDTLNIEIARQKAILNDGNIDTLKDIIQTFDGNLAAFRDLSIPTLENLYLSGNLELFDEDRRKLLLELRFHKNTYQAIHELAFDIFNNASQKFWEDYGFDEGGELLGPEFEKLVWDTSNDRLLIIRIKNVMNTKYNFQVVGFGLRKDYRNAMISFIANTY